MGLGLQLFLIMVAALLVVVAKYRHTAHTLIADWHEFQAWREERPTTPILVQPTTSPALDLKLLPGAGRALANPPADLAMTLRELDLGGGSYSIPLGWRLSSGGEPDCVNADLVGDVNHILVSGQSDSGKDNAVLGMMFALTHRYTPQRLQICIVDGKGLDWAAWEPKAHCWRLALDPEDIKPTMQALTQERQRRRRILQAAQVAKWDEYQGTDLPLLVVYVSELLLLQNATSKSELTNWLNSELTAARAFGIRYIIATQTASNFDTQWRSQISLFLAGFQPAQSQDAPNTGLTTNELKALGAVPPSELPSPPAGAGVFNAIQGRSAFTIRSSYINSAQRQRWLATMPDKSPQQPPVITAAAAPRTAPTSQQNLLLELLQTGQPLPLTDELSTIDRAGGSALPGHSEAIKAQSLHASPALHASPTTERERHLTGDGEAVGLDVPEVEAQRIIEAAKTAASRREICQTLYNTTGGKKYEWVKQVCNARGLLQA